MCQHHRNQAELHNLQQTATRHALSITDRLHLDSLLRVIAGPDAGRGIDLNAMREMADVAAAAKQTKEANKEEKAAAFASALTSHAMDVAPTSTTTTAAAGAAPITPLRVRTSSSASSSSSSSLFSPGAARSLATPSSFTSSSSPPAARPLVPVVIFITGGAWSIGYKAWGALLGLGLSAHGVLVASADYRNFPQGDIESMLLDVQTAIT
jgi:acetyl esterase/lipase